MAKTALLVAGIPNPDEWCKKFLKELANKIVRLAYIPGNMKRYTEVYFDGPEEDAEALAREFQGIPAPVRGILMAETFENIISSKTFKMMGGKVIGRDKNE